MFPTNRVRKFYCNLQKRASVEKPYTSYLKLPRSKVGHFLRSALHLQLPHVQWPVEHDEEVNMLAGQPR